MGAGYSEGITMQQCFYNKGPYFRVRLDMANYHEGQDATGALEFALMDG